MKFSLREETSKLCLDISVNSCDALSPAPPPPPCSAGWSPSPAIAGEDEELAPSRRDRYGTAMLHSAVLNVMIKAARRAGRSLKRDLGEIEHLQVSLKGPRNFVTAADRRAEQIVHEELAKARPAYGFLGEEGGARAGTDKSHRWIVDPLDGTTNFLHGIPHFAVSIALERDGAIVAGLIYNPANEELFVAERGKGAFLNDQRIRVAARSVSPKRWSPAACRITAAAATWCWRATRSPPRNSILPGCAATARRRSTSPGSPPEGSMPIGSATCRRGTSPPGMILVREAGGFVSDCDGDDAIMTKGEIAAGNDTMHRELLRLLKAAKSGSRSGSKQGGRRAIGAINLPQKLREVLSREDKTKRLQKRTLRPIVKGDEHAFSCHTRYAIIGRRFRALNRTDGERPQKTFVTPHLPHPDAGIPDPVRPDRVRAAAPDFQRLPRQSVAQRADHRRAG